LRKQKTLEVGALLPTMHTIGFRGPKSKNWHSGTVLDDTDVSDQRNGTSKEGRKTARGDRATWHGPCSILAWIFSGG